MIAGRRASVALRGSLQQRRDIVPGVPMHGFECTISVDDVDAAIAAVAANGGKIVMKKCTLVGIGQLFFFQAPDGNSPARCNTTSTPISS